MSKELKALERIKREAGMPYFSTLYDIDMWREDFSMIRTALTKLAELEDIEAYLGIDLITLFKLYETKKVWAYSNSGKVKVDLDGISIIKREVALYNGICQSCYSFKQYGKAFALTEGELL